MIRVQSIYKPAGFWIRGAAFFIDTLLIGIVVAPLSWIVLRIFHLPENSMEDFDRTDAVTVVLLLVSASYHVTGWLRSGTTVGKSWTGLKVVRGSDGGSLRWYNAVLRWIFYLPSCALLGVGFLMAAVHPRKWAAHDLLSGTQVVRAHSRVTPASDPPST